MRAPPTKKEIEDILNPKPVTISDILLEIEVDLESARDDLLSIERKVELLRFYLKEKESNKRRGPHGYNT